MPAKSPAVAKFLSTPWSPEAATSLLVINGVSGKYSSSLLKACRVDTVLKDNNGPCPKVNSSKSTICLSINYRQLYRNHQNQTNKRTNPPRHHPTSHTRLDYHRRLIILRLCTIQRPIPAITAETLPTGLGQYRARPLCTATQNRTPHARRPLLVLCAVAAGHDVIPVLDHCVAVVVAVAEVEGRCV